MTAESQPGQGNPSAEAVGSPEDVDPGSQSAEELILAQIPAEIEGSVGEFAAAAETGDFAGTDSVETGDCHLETQFA